MQGKAGPIRIILKCGGSMSDDAIESILNELAVNIRIYEFKMSTNAQAEPLDKIIKEAAHQIRQYIEAEIIGKNEIDETGINATTQWGLRIENRNHLRAEQLEKLREPME
jgi:hypothetical protein